MTATAKLFMKVIGGAVCACVGGATSPGCNLIGCSAQSVGAGRQQPVYKTTNTIDRTGIAAEIRRSYSAAPDGD